MRKLGFAATLSLVVGNIIGVGIFTTTGYITQYLQTPLLILLAWLIGGFYALSGARVYGLLSGAYPLSGGDYQYLKHELHPLAAYLFGWSALFVTYSGSIAALGIAAAHYLNIIIDIPFFDLSFQLIEIGSVVLNYTTPKLIAIFMIILFSWINYRGIYLSSLYQIILTAAIFIMLLAFSAAGLFSPSADYQLLLYVQETPVLFSGFLTALIAVIFSYSGWTTAVYVAEEIKEAEYSVPKSLLTGVILVGIIYIVINSVYLIALPVSDMPDVINIASVVFERLWGSGSAFFVSFVILIAVLSSLNSTVLSGPRIYMAMGREGYFGGYTARIHPVFSSPYKAIVVQMSWSIILVLSGSFNQLLNFVIFVIIAFSLIAAWIAWQITGRQNKRTIANKSAIAFYAVFCLAILLNILFEKPIESIIGFLIVSSAVPVYFMETKRIDNKRL